MKNKLVVFGGAGTGIAAICCFTSVLVIALTAVGAAGAIAYLDMVLFPMLAFFIVLTGYGLYRAKRPGGVPQKEECCDVPAGSVAMAHHRRSGRSAISTAKE